MRARLHNRSASNRQTFNSTNNAGLPPKSRMSRAVLRALAPGLAALSIMASAAVADEPLFRFRVHDRPAAEHDAGKGNRLSDHRAGPAGDLPRRLIRKRARKARRLARIDRGFSSSIASSASTNTSPMQSA
jgi:hypothetical protein